MNMDNGASSYRRFRENGDRNGLVEIIRDYKDGLILYLTSIVGDVHTAEDLAEDTFVLLGTRKPRDKGRGSFKTWLYTIGRNIAFDYLRKQSRKKEVNIEQIGEITDDEINLEKSFITKERDRAVHRAMKCLNNDYRQVLWLIYFEGFSNKECAAVMDKSEHAIETLAYRARKALKPLLEKEGIVESDLL